MPTHEARQMELIIIDVACASADEMRWRKLLDEMEKEEDGSLH